MTLPPGGAPHAPVMVAECLTHLAVTPGAWYLDGTFGAGGHTRALLAAGGNVLALDRDPSVARFLPEEALASGRLRFVEGNFDALDRHAATAGVGPLAGVLLDLGVSSMQLDEAERGFSFRHPGPLDMRMGSSGLCAADLVNNASQEELASLIFRYGEERYSRRIARRIVAARAQAPITTTHELAEIIARAYPPGPRRDHPARRTFQALRVAVNDELGALERALAAAERALAPGGRVVVLTYHSLEDRIVKRAFKSSARLTPLTKKPLTASAAEVAANPRARAAKLRAAQRVVDGAGATDMDDLTPTLWEDR
jgi:16S rRNA (cytosine1402-N4)-methyltransferase